MAAKGKINASKVQAGDRIIVKLHRNDAGLLTHITESPTKTGEDVIVALVIGKHFRAAQGPYECRGKYVIETSAGLFEAAPIQTMWLAPEDAAGVKRAHVEALLEDAERDRQETLREARQFEETGFAARVTALIGHGITHRAAVRRVLDILHGEALREDQARTLDETARRVGLEAQRNHRGVTLVAAGEGIQIHVFEDDEKALAWLLLSIELEAEIENDRRTYEAETAQRTEIEDLRAEFPGASTVRQVEIVARLAALGTVVYPPGTPEHDRYATDLRAALKDWRAEPLVPVNEAVRASARNGLTAPLEAAGWSVSVDPYGTWEVLKDGRPQPGAHADQAAAWAKALLMALRTI